MKGAREGSIDAMISGLDAELDQERKVDEDHESFFVQAPEAQVLIARAREYDDLEKHLVRKEHWLSLAKRLKKQKQAPLKLLTLPGRYSFEVELYRREGIFGDAEEAKRLPVVAFETSPEIFGLLETMEPGFDKLYNADLVDTLVRESSRYYRELRGSFPFDIVNLDLTVNLVAPSDGPYGPFLQAIRQCLLLQGTQVDEWMLMVTFRFVSGETSPDTIEELTRVFQENLDQHPAVKDACAERYKTVRADALLGAAPGEALGQFLAKWIVDQAHVFEWKMEEVRHLWYERGFATGSYTIRKLVFRFQKRGFQRHQMPARKAPVASWHIEDLVEVVKAAHLQNISDKIAKLRKAKPDYIKRLEDEVSSLRESAS